MREIRVSQEAIKAVYAENKFLKRRIRELERELAEKNRQLKRIITIILRKGKAR